MKTIWNKTPAWLKALLLLVISYYPVATIVQGAVILNLEKQATWSWALLIAIPAWVLYGYLVKRYNPYKGENDVKLEWSFNLRNKKAWYRVVAMICLTYGLIHFTEAAFHVLPDNQLDLINQFKALEPFVAIPLLLVISFNAGFVEELVFRGFVQNTLSKAYGIRVAILGVGVIFALVHFLPWPLVAAYIIVSAGFSLVAYGLKSTAPGIWGHIIFDFLVLLNVYYNVVETGSTQALYLSIVLTVVGLFFLFKNNQVFKSRGVKKPELAVVRDN